MNSELEKFLSNLPEDKLLLIGQIIDNYSQDTLEYIYHALRKKPKDVINERISLIKKEAKVNILPISSRLSSSYIGNERVNYLERVGISNNISLPNTKSQIIRSIKIAISIFEEHMIYLSELYPSQDLNLNLFYLYSLKKREIVNRQFRDILKYLLEKSKENDSVCIFGLGIMEDIKQMIERHYNETKLQEPQRKVIDILTNYSILPHLEDNDFSYFDKLLVPKVMLK